jgi:DivIVA domain-containing protein
MALGRAADPAERDDFIELVTCGKAGRDLRAADPPAAVGAHSCPRTLPCAVVAMLSVAVSVRLCATRRPCRTYTALVCHDARVTTALIYLVVMLLVAAVVFLLAAVVFGRGEELAPLPPGSSPTRLPVRDITGDDVQTVRFQLVLRGYKMSEVDWVMRRLGGEIDVLRARVAELEAGHTGDNSSLERPR